MRVKTFTRFAKQMPASWLPFADVSSAGLPLPRLLRLTLFKFTMGMTTALMIGTLNRVMIVELGVPAWLVSLMLALPLLVAPFRAVTGFQSDVHVSAFGWRRVPYLWGGTLIQFLGLAVMPFALLVLSGRGQIAVPDFVGQAAAGIAFLLVGAGLQTSQTAGLALATDQASEETRPRVVALLYTMLLVGAVSGSLIFSLLLSNFTPEHLVQVVQGSALVVLVLNAIALWKQEPRNPQRVAALKMAAQPRFRDVWAQFIALPQARRFLWATAFGTTAFNMQDIVLEPYGGEILKLSVGATSALTAMLAAGGLIGFYFSGRQLAKGIDPMRLAAYGALAGLPAFSAVIFSAPLDAGWLFASGPWASALVAVCLLWAHCSPRCAWKHSLSVWPLVPGVPCNRPPQAWPCSSVEACATSSAASPRKAFGVRRWRILPWLTARFTTSKCSFCLSP